MKIFDKFIWLSFSVFFYSSASFAAESIIWNDVTYDTDTVAQLITVITSTSLVQSIPATKHLYPAQASLFSIPALAKCKKIIVFDGIEEKNENLERRYEEYKKNVIELTQTDPYFSNTKLIFCPEWRHLTGALYEALQHVTTPFLYIHQHDLQIIQEFDLNGLIATMVANPRIQCVMLAGGDNGAEGDFNAYHGYIDRQIEGEHFVPLMRCFGWSDQAQITTVDYYRNVIFPQCKARKGNFMEQTMLHRIRYDVAKLGKDIAHPIYACYLYGGSADGAYIVHTDAKYN
jgi:hypothetical protein